MENEIPQAEDSFAKEVAKSFVLSTAASAGVFAGLMVVGLAAGWISRRNTVEIQNTETK